MRYSLGEDALAAERNESWIAPTAVVIGRVRLGKETSIWWNAVLRGDTEPITIGDRTNIQDGCVLHTDEGFPLTVGAGVTVGHLAMLHGCTIGDGCLIGIGAVILNGARIGSNCIVGAKALIGEGKVIPDDSVVLGVPGRVIGSVSAKQAEGAKWAADHYVENLRRYRSSLRRDD
jgi:carbonic anhydrase/acetyltransferase-like protein (isoleucine patch superfamily)